MTKLVNPTGRFITLFRVGTVEIGFTPSWLFMVTFLAILFRRWGVIPVGTGRVAGAALAVGLSLAFYISVLLHEAAHTAVAYAFELQPRRIVLFLLGGVSQISRDAEAPREEYVVALAGPVVSLFLGGVLAVVAHSTGSAASPVWGSLSTLNIALAAFNMIPGFPLDGGRVLRSVIWAVRRDRIKATRLAASAGRLVAVGLSVGGVAYVWIVQHDRTSIAFAAWYLVLGYFLFSHASYAERDELERLAARREAMRTVIADPVKDTVIAPDIVPQKARRGVNLSRVTPKTAPTTISSKTRSSRRPVEAPRPTARLDVLKKPRSHESHAKKSKKSGRR